MNNKSVYTLYGILAFWVVILVGIFALHIAIPLRFLFLMAFLCVGWLAWWSITTVRRVLLYERSYKKFVAEYENDQPVDSKTNPEPNSNTTTTNNTVTNEK